MAKRLREDSLSSQQPSPPEDFTAHTPKYAELDTPSPQDQDPSNNTMLTCTLPPHAPLTFPSYPLYESHYTQSHTNRCSSCHINLPTAHFLSLHLSETHDPLLATRRDRGEKTFSCFVEDCEKVCRDWKKRRSHLVDKHGFPRNYDFLVVERGIDGRKSMLRPGVDEEGHRRSSRERGERGSSVATESTLATEVTDGSQPAVSEEGEDAGGVKRSEPSKESQSVEKQPKSSTANTAMYDITKSMSSLQFVPRSVTFGKRKGKSGFAKS